MSQTKNNQVNTEKTLSEETKIEEKAETKSEEKNENTEFSDSKEEK